MADTVSQDRPAQLLGLVFGGELENVGGHEFKDLQKLDIVVL